MQPDYQHFQVDRKEDVFCVRLRRNHMEEPQILAFTDELLRLISNEGCKKMVLSLGPGQVDCLYSVFLAKLVMVRRNLYERGGAMKIAEASPAVVGIFEACHLSSYFEFHPTVDAAVASFAA